MMSRTENDDRDGLVGDLMARRTIMILAIARLMWRQFLLALAVAIKKRPTRRSRVMMAY